MKIGFFANTYYPNTYGSTVSVEYFRKGLEKLGHQVYIFTPGFSGYKDRHENVFRYPSVIWNYKKIKYPLAISYYPPVNKIAQELDLDIIHSHQPFSVGKDGMRQARRNKIPIVFTHHCRYEDYTHYIPIIPQLFLRWHVKRRATVFANKCNHVITPTKQIKQMIVSRGVTTKISILPTGIDWHKYQNGKRSKTRNKFGIKEDDICLLWVGRMQVEKNLNFLFEAVKGIIKNKQNLKMIFVGSGPEEGMLKKKTQKEGIEDKMFFVGLIKQEEIQDYYSAGDIFLQTSLTETQGMTTTEALASGLAVVAIRATGAVDLIENQQTGLLVENDQECFINAINELIKNQKRRFQLGKNARKEARRYDYLEKARELEMIYLEETEKFVKSKNLW